MTTLDQYIRQAIVVNSSQTCREAQDLFKKHTEIECLVICDKAYWPIGLMMRHRFFNQMGNRFSADLYYEKSISIIMDKQPLIVQTKDQPHEVIDLALSRNEKMLYDCVIVQYKEKLAGILTVSDLMKLSRALQQQAQEMQMKIISSAEQRANQIEEAVSLVRTSTEQGQAISINMVNLSRLGKQELNHVMTLFQSISSMTQQQEHHMAELEQETGSIHYVSSLIKDLAEQSQLLAINASIEAARAGEYGRGFGVVAEEIMKLADQTKKSAIEISEITQSIIQSIERTSTLAQSSRKEALASELTVHEAATLLNNLLQAADENRDSSKQIGMLSEQAHQQSIHVVKEMLSLRLM